MKTAHLHDLWDTPDNSRLTTKQFSFRLPVHIGAKINALCEMYPQKNRTQIVADLLTAALDDLEKHLPEELGSPMDAEAQHYERMAAEEHGHEYIPLFDLGGPRGRFRNIANRHYAELEKELGNENATPLYRPIWVTEAEMKAKKS
jgi:hypothetical protein